MSVWIPIIVMAAIGVAFACCGSRNETEWDRALGACGMCLLWCAVALAIIAGFAEVPSSFWGTDHSPADEQKEKR